MTFTVFTQEQHGAVSQCASLPLQPLFLTPLDLKKAPAKFKLPKGLRGAALGACAGMQPLAVLPALPRFVFNIPHI